MKKHLTDIWSDGETIRLIGRSSRLSLLQIEIVRKKIQEVLPQINVEVIARNSKGDELQNVPLHTVEGSDFFTKDIFEALENGEADIAVHSLKDMSSEHFFGENKFAVVDRDDIRDVAIFNADIEEKIVSGQPIIIGTCSPRREEMAMVFLKKALPQLHKDIRIKTQPIRGNVETRLRKLNSGEFDATILATAGLNRLLSSTQDRLIIKELLKDKKLMILPLIECVPAPCQGAIAAEAFYKNEKAIAILEEINDKKLFDDCVKEKKAASQYGKGCLQQFGVTTVSYGNNATLYAAGKDENGKEFTHWYDIPELKAEGKIFFSSTEHMGSFFEYEYSDIEITIAEPVVYVSNYKAIRRREFLKNKRVWASGTKTWYELAKQGIWVEGGADAFGLEFLKNAWSMPLLHIKKEDVHILTNEHGADNWRTKGWAATGTYSTVALQKKELAKQIAEADIIFWTSFQQYELYKNVLKENVQHVCPSGETAVLLRAASIEPIVFPNIKAFQQWKKTFIPSHNVA
jgi:hydroxymethylbilane synthase